MEWHQLTAEEAIEQLKTTKKGLSQGDADLRLQRFGLNQILEHKKRGGIILFFSQFKDLMVIILLIAAILAGFLGNIIDAIVITLISLLNALIGFYQELRTERAIQALKKGIKVEAKVFRDLEIVVVDEKMIVPGDVVSLEAGNLVPADLRILSTSYLKIDESALTGESMPVNKTATQISQPNLTIGDQNDMAFKGTFVTHGHAHGVVVATGINTQIGAISKLLQIQKTRTPLQKNMTDFTKKLSVVILILCLLFFISNWLYGRKMLDMLLTSISLAIAAIPEALPTIIIMSLALAARRMFRQKALVRNLAAIETLGAVKYICTDKTGTLTKNKMEVTQIYINNKLISIKQLATLKAQQDLDLLLHAFALNNDVVPDNGQSGIGESTEIALMNVARAHHIDPRKFNRLAEIPFDGKRKQMTTFHTYQNKIISFTKGAPELLIHKCVRADIPAIEAAIKTMASEGQRTMGFAYRYWDTLPQSPESEESGLTFIGLAGMTDAPREEIIEAVQVCKLAGIKIIMITGDHPLTAASIGRKIGLIDQGNEQLLSGQQLIEMDDDNLFAVVENIKIFARVSPEQKLRIIQMIRKKGHYMAMIGDGVNDAPALKAADIGVAMGITGTDFTKQHADMVLLDDNFTTIIKAVAEGRRTYDNILKSIKYLLTTNSGELFTLLICPILAMPLTLLPIHILWTNLISDGLPAISLAYEKAEPGIMKRAPRRPKEGVFSKGRGIHILMFGILIALVVLLIQGWALENGYAWRTMAFNTLCLTQMGSVLASRSENQSLFKLGLFSNLPLLLAVAVVFILQLMVTYIPNLQPIFHTEALSIEEFIVVGCASSIVFIWMELYKIMPVKKPL